MKLLRHKKLVKQLDQPLVYKLNSSVILENILVVSEYSHYRTMKVVL